MTEKKISVLVVDDSTFIRKALTRMLNSDPEILVIGDAKDGFEAIEKVKRLEPDVLTLDVNMPDMDGITALKRIMAVRPMPVLMISAVTSEGGEVTLEALKSGAVDFIDKSTCNTMMEISNLTDELIRKVKVISRVDLTTLRRIPTADVRPKAPQRSVRRPSQITPEKMILLGTSTGGPVALETVLSRLPDDLSAAVMIAQHMPIGFTRSLAERLNRVCPLPVKEAEEDDQVLEGRVFVAPSGYQIGMRQNDGEYFITLKRGGAGDLHRPSVDMMIEAVAEVWSGSILCIILTGMGEDGAKGIRTVKQRGGTVLAQDEETCVVYGMPRAAQSTGYVDRSVKLGNVAVEMAMYAKRSERADLNEKNRV